MCKLDKNIKFLMKKLFRGYLNVSYNFKQYLLFSNLILKEMALALYVYNFWLHKASDLPWYTMSTNLDYFLSLLKGALLQISDNVGNFTCIYSWEPQWCSGNTLISHLGGQRLKPWTLCEKVGSFLPMVGSLQYRTLTNCTYCWKRH